MEKINLVELLRDCPNGMELDSTVFDNITFDYVNTQQNRVYCKVGKSESVWFTPKGGVNLLPYAKCVIFPKGKTTWEGFVPPCKFKNGDIIFTHTNASKGLLENSWVSIFKEYRNNRCACYACLCLSGLELYNDKWEDELLCELCGIEENRLATEEEKTKLFKAIKANGYKWNAETKTLEKMVEPKFKVGDRVKSKLNGSYLYDITDVTNTHYVLIETINKFRYVEDIIEDKNWELVPNKFDITTLKPFDKVLTRANNDDSWVCNLYSHRIKDYYVVLNAELAPQCIPYEQNKHLLGTTNDCNEFYKNW